MNGTSNTKGIIQKSYRFPWYMPWKVNDLKIGQGKDVPIEVTWDCQDSDFTIIFPANGTPFPTSEIHSTNKHASATLDAARLGKLRKSTVRYAIILTDPGNEDVVEGENSPPTMVIE